jgi:hypothetical protein
LGAARLFQSPLLIGSAKSFDSGRLAIKAGAGDGRKLLLEGDPVYGERPAGADPLDIRDVMDWLEPQIDLDARGLRREAQMRAARWIPAWRDWTLDEAEFAPVLLVNASDGFNSRWRLEAKPVLPYLKLSRQMKLNSGESQLYLSLSHAAGAGPGALVHVRVDHQIIKTFETPERRAGNLPEPLVISLSKYRGGDVTIDLIQEAGGARASVEWAAVRILERR